MAGSLESTMYVLSYCLSLNFKPIFFSFSLWLWWHGPLADMCWLYCKYIGICLLGNSFSIFFRPGSWWHLVASNFECLGALGAGGEKFREPRWLEAHFLKNSWWYIQKGKEPSGWEVFSAPKFPKLAGLPILERLIQDQVKRNLDGIS